MGFSFGISWNRSQSEPAKQETGFALATRTTSVRSEFVEPDKIKNLSDLIQRLPEPNETIDSLCHKNYNAWTFVPVILEKIKPETLKELWVSVLSFNEKNILHLADLLDTGQIEKASVICSVHFKALNKKQHAVGHQALTSRGQRLIEMLNHSKVIAAATTDNRFFVLRTSANLRSCASVEQYTFTQNKELFEFYTGWMEQEFARHA